MANVQLYTDAKVAVNGKLLSEHASVTISRNTNSQAVNTVAKGYAGESPGAASIEIDVDNAVPSADFEMDPGQFMQELKSCELSVYVAGKAVNVVGFIISDNFKHAVNSEAMLSFKFRGGFAAYE